MTGAYQNLMGCSAMEALTFPTLSLSASFSRNNAVDVGAGGCDASSLDSTCNEQWKVCDARNFPVELAQIVRTGRHHGLRYMTATHRPRDYHATLRSLVTEWVAFSMCEPDELKAVRDYWPGVERAASLNKGEFIACNVRSRAELAGRLF